MPNTRSIQPASGRLGPEPLGTPDTSHHHSLACEQAATAVEYAVMLALMIIVMLTGLILLGGRLNTMFDTIVHAGWAKPDPPP